jgi:integrase
MRVLDPGGVRALAEAIAEPYGVLVYVLAFGGLRWGEACALRRSRCDLLRGRLEVVESLAEIGGELYFGEPKTYQRRWVRLPRFVSVALAAHLEANVARTQDALVFTSPNGAPLRYTNFRRRQWHPALRAAAVDPKLTPHQLRHFCASFLHSRGASLKAIQEQLGHSSPTMTLSVYTHLFGGDLDGLYDGLEEPLAASLRPEPMSDVASLTLR